MDTEFYTEISDVKPLINAEKQDIRRKAMFITFALMIAMAVSVFWGNFYLEIMEHIGIDNTSAIALIRDPVVMQLVNILLSSLMFTIPFLVVTSGCSVKVNQIIDFTKPKKGLLLPFVFLGLGICGFANIASNIITAFLSGFGINIPIPDIGNAKGLLGGIISFICVAVITPLSEEFAMRGIVMGILRKNGESFAICTSAVIFALIHGNLQQIPFAFIVGLFLGLAVVKTGSVWTGVIIHAVNNASAFALSRLNTIISDDLIAFSSAAFLVLCLICAFIGIITVKDKTKEVLTIDSQSEHLSPKKATGTFFSSPFIIIYIFVTLFKAFTLS